MDYPGKCSTRYTIRSGVVHRSGRLRQNKYSFYPGIYEEVQGLDIGRKMKP